MSRSLLLSVKRRLQWRSAAEISGAIAWLLFLLAACGEPGSVPNRRTEGPDDRACFAPDLSLETKPANLEDARRLGDTLGIRLPQLPPNLGVEVAEAGVLDDGDSKGLLVNLGAESRHAPLVALRITPEPQCYQSASEPIAEISGIGVFTVDTNTFTGYSTWFEAHSMFVALEVTWLRDAAPSVDERLGYVSAWVAALVES